MAKAARAVSIDLDPPTARGRSVGYRIGEDQSGGNGHGGRQRRPDRGHHLDRHLRAVGTAAARSGLPAAIRLTPPPPKQKPTAGVPPSSSQCMITRIPRAYSLAASLHRQRRHAARLAFHLLLLAESRLYRSDGSVARRASRPSKPRAHSDWL